MVDLPAIPAIFILLSRGWPSQALIRRTSPLDPEQLIPSGQVSWKTTGKPLENHWENHGKTGISGWFLDFGTSSKGRCGWRSDLTSFGKVIIVMNAGWRKHRDDVSMLHFSHSRWAMCYILLGRSDDIIWTLTLMLCLIVWEVQNVHKRGVKHLRIYLLYQLFF